VPFVDKTTLEELSVFRHDRDPSLYRLLDRTATLGGRVLFKRLLEQPGFNRDDTEARRSEIRYYRDHLAVLKPFQDLLKTAAYLQVIRDSTSTYAYRNTTPLGEGFRRAFEKTRLDLRQFFAELFSALEGARGLANTHKTVAELTRLTTPFRLPHGKASRRRLQWLTYEKHAKAFSRMVECLHKLDCWVSLALVHEEYDLRFPQWAEEADSPWELVGLWNLALGDPTANDLRFGSRREHVFLTGPNRAGKTTFLKAIGQALYLARCGFGVPAESARLPWVDTLATAFEVTGSLVKGKSFFAAEVDRALDLVDACRDTGLSVLLIDELFKGTNLVDAQDCLRYFVELTSRPLVVCLIATHFGAFLKTLAGELPMINYSFEATQGDGLGFDYKLRPGISEQRLGLHLLRTERQARATSPEDPLNP